MRNCARNHGSTAVFGSDIGPPMGTAVFCGAIFLSTGVPSRRVLFAVFEQPGLPPISVRTRALRSGLVAMGHPFVEWALAACLAASGGGGAPMHLGAVFIEPPIHQITRESRHNIKNPRSPWVYNAEREASLAERLFESAKSNSNPTIIFSASFSDSACTLMFCLPDPESSETSNTNAFMASRGSILSRST